MMRKQVEVQSANSLPIFEAELLWIHSQGDFPTPQLTIINVGGMARYPTVELVTVATVTVISEDLEHRYVKRGEMIYSNYLSTRNTYRRSELEQEDWGFTSPEISLNFKEIEQLANKKYSDQYEGLSLVVQLTHVFTVSYTDYLGVSRTEHYLLKEYELDDASRGGFHTDQTVQPVDDERWSQIEAALLEMRELNHVLFGGGDYVESQAEKMVRIIESWPELGPLPTPVSYRDWSD